MPADVAFDATALIELFDGDVPAVRDVLTLAMASVGNDIARLAVESARHDAPAAALTAHRLKGTCATLGAARAAAAAAAVEDAARAASPQLAHATHMLGDAIDALLAAIATTLRTQGDR